MDNLHSKTIEISPNNNVRNKTHSKVVFCESMGVITWIYLISKILLFDIDKLFIELLNPAWLYLLDYRFFIIIGFFGSLWLLLGNKMFLQLLMTILFYPFVFLFWRIPRLFWRSKSWIGIFTSLEILLTIMSSVKSSFIMFSVASITSILILKVTQSWILIPSMICLFLYLTYHYFTRFKYAFQPSLIFALQKEFLNNYWIKIKNYLHLGDEILEAEIDEMDANQKLKWINNLQYAIILNKVLGFISIKMKKFQHSRINIVFYFLNIFVTLLITIVVFALLNYATMKLENQAFSTYHENFIFYLYYSFNTMFTNSINDFYPIADMARLLNSIEILFAFLLLAIIFFLFTTIIRDKHNEEINSIIQIMNIRSSELEVQISTDYKMNMDEAINLVKQLEGGFLAVIYYFVKNIDNED